MAMLPAATGFSNHLSSSVYANPASFGQPRRDSLLNGPSDMFPDSSYNDTGDGFSLQQGMTAGKTMPQPASPPSYSPAQIAVQTYMPVGARRRLTDDEIMQIEQNQKYNWFGKLCPSFLTPVPQMMANPTKFAVLSGLGGAFLGAVAPFAFLASSTKEKGPLAAVSLGTALVLGSAFAVMGYLAQRKKNEDLTDLMSRYPTGSTLRDILSDPAKQAELNRHAMGSSCRWIY